MKRLILAGFLVLCSGAVRAAAQAPGGVFVGKSVRIDRPVEGRLVVLGGTLLINASVSGDVISSGAAVSLGPGGSIRGRLIMFGGDFSGTAAGVTGGILTPGSLAAVYLAEARRSPLAPSPAGERRTVFALRLFILAVWMVVATCVLWWRPSALVRAATTGETDPGRSALAGLLTVFLLFAGAVAALAALPAGVRFAVAAIIALLAAALKIFGMAALFLMVGQRCLSRLEPRARPAALAVGLAILGAVSIVPVLGPLAWSAASVYAVGMAALTRFGAPRFRVAVA